LLTEMRPGERHLNDLVNVRGEALAFEILDDRENVEAISTTNRQPAREQLCDARA
jgi:hypothetical protein